MLTSIIAGDGAATARLPMLDEVAHDPTVCQNQIYLGHEALRQAHLPIRGGGLGLTSSSSIKNAAYIGCHALVLGGVVAASARGNLPSLLERLPERPMASALIEELKTVATETKRSQTEDTMGPGGEGGRGGGGVGQREQWEDPLATQSDGEIELSQANRGVGGVCVGAVPRVQSKLSRVLHAHRGSKLLQDLQTQESAQMKKVMARFRRAREKSAVAFVECLGISQEDTMEGPLWRETLGRSMGSHDVAKLVGEMGHGKGCRQETTRLHAISCANTRWSSLTHNRVLHQALARPLRESKVEFVDEDTWSFREELEGKTANSTRYVWTPQRKREVLFDNHPRLKNKALLLDITIVNSCAGFNLGNTARRIGKHLADAVERKKNKYRGSFSATYSLLPLAMSTCGEVGSNVHALIKELAIKRVEHRSETHINESQDLVEGAEVARLRRRFSFVLQQALSFRTRHHLCRQGVALTSTRQFRSQGPVSVQAHRTEGVTGSEGHEGANGVGGGKGDDNGVGGGNGDVNGHGDGDGDGKGAGAGTGTGTGVEVNEGAQDGNGDGSGCGAGTGPGTGVETHRRTPDGNGDGNRDGSKDSSGDGNGDEDNVNGNEDRIGESGREAKKRKKPQNSFRCQVGNGGDLGGNRKICRKERVGSVAANSDNLESNKEAEGGAQGTLGSSKNCTSRESVSTLSRLIRGFRNKYH